MLRPVDLSRENAFYCPESDILILLRQVSISGLTDLQSACFDFLGPEEKESLRFFFWTTVPSLIDVYLAGEDSFLRIGMRKDQLSAMAVRQDMVSFLTSDLFRFLCAHRDDIQAQAVFPLHSYALLESIVNGNPISILLDRIIPPSDPEDGLAMMISLAAEIKSLKGERRIWSPDFILGSDALQVSLFSKPDAGIPLSIAI